MKKWLLSIAIKKAIKKIVQLIISVLLGVGIVKSGLIEANISTEQLTIFLTSLFMGLSEIIRNFLKVKFPKKLGWL